MRFLNPALVIAALGVPAMGVAQQRPAFELTIANIMRGPEVYGREPQRVRWSADGRHIYFYWNAPGTKWSEPLQPYRVRAVAGATPERLTEAQIDSAGPLFADGSYTRDRRLKVTSYEGDLYLIEARTSRVTRITQTVANESNPSIAANGAGAYFVRDNNIYYVEFASGLVRQITDVRSGPAPRDSTFAGQRGALRSQQAELFDAIRERARLDSLSRSNRREHEARQPTPLYLNQGEQVGQLSISPTGTALLVQTSVPAPASRQTEVPSFVTASGYTEPLRVRTKVGDEQSSGRIAFVPLGGGDVRWLRVIPTDTVRPPANVFV
ncbi:MAG: TolB family protein, partial [Gemmatimonadaceae bacterium]